LTTMEYSSESYFSTGQVFGDNENSSR
jgi:hypothetical protein